MCSRVCMNGQCGAASSSEWKKGWPLRSGEFAYLCDSCRAAYEQLIFCDVFHKKETGWRECLSCGKSLHCGCIASRSLLELLDRGGVKCMGCTKSSDLQSIPAPGRANGCSAPTIGEKQSISMENHLTGANSDKSKNAESKKSADNINRKSLLQSLDVMNESFGQIKQEEVLPPTREDGDVLSLNFTQAPFKLFQNVKLDSDKGYTGFSDVHGSVVQTNLSIAFPAPSEIVNPFLGATTGERDSRKFIPSLQQGPRSRHLLPKPSSSTTISQIRVARPPVEGRGKNQLLPRYWPRITDQELQQIYGDSNSTIVPLFEKVLSASDAGRIGRLVLPKACAEAYFPPISQPEGLPLRIQDVKGKEWMFQFRFWPNNNSRMYVLEGVTPCIQSMQLQAGDTVIFSRMDPEGKLLMGFRKATNVLPAQDMGRSGPTNGDDSSDPSLLTANEYLAVIGGYSGHIQLNRSKDSSLSALSKHFDSGDPLSNFTQQNGSKNEDGASNPPLLASERKRSRNIGSKSKRLLIDSHDALELKLTWEELQDMLRPPPSVQPSTISIDDYEFEEYEEPPVFAKRSIFTVRLSGEQEQWAQCDSCFKWRKLPVDFLLPPKWTCGENIWDRCRCSCSAPDELNPRELESLLKMDNDMKKQRAAMARNQGDSSDADALTNTEANGGDVSEHDNSVATTTKHPRHRPGCSCIVCIQPPSGKGKHKPTCTCNVCMTVKRRFKTLMMRKKKRQSEREAEIAQRSHSSRCHQEEAEVDSVPRQATPLLEPSEKERTGSEVQQLNQSNQKVTGNENERLDLNFCPVSENVRLGSSSTSMMSLVQEASLPLERYLRQNGLTSLVSEPQASSGSHVPPQISGESEVRLDDDNCNAPVEQEPERQLGEEHSEPDQHEDDHLF